ncbi:DGQHR domain-containing protein [Billgrantia tianxiuensis]|uniref:DGQHR domain-containing protein n=1 Tax=Billgrantia tianxiuensis TaxID=2497861 RepID=A0A6I6SMR5_9GAMM|nr:MULTISPECIES: DGQHR domain-containing protein [Halomonas]MCE8033118.1 DGQHR domain-containing protein [Halomonas sp. MCCC 1A11057]QHC48887.1 DGQHR domain-containing protein [Halomonas tianxiuensis]
MKVLKVLKVDQPIGEFYIGAIDSRDLLEIATVDIREFSEGNPGEIDGIQRELSPGRLSALKEYVNLDYATFPTSVILAIDERCVEVKGIGGCDGLFNMEISGYEGDEDSLPIPLSETAFVIDGQHRLAGLIDRDHKKGPFEVNVSIFVGADIADQAEIFSRVNLAQTKVNKSLMYDLLDYAKEKSPYKVAHDIVVALNNDVLETSGEEKIDGPFYHRIKRLGKRTPGVSGETLAQATVVNGLLRHLPKNQEKERSKSILGFGGRREPRESWRDRIFVNFYREEDFLSILLIVSNYFEAVRQKWPVAWNSEEQGMILSRTTGYNALIRFLKDAYLELVDSPRVVEKSEFLEIFSRIDIPDEELNSEVYLPGSSGAGLLYRHLVQQGLKNSLSRQAELL